MLSNAKHGIASYHRVHASPPQASQILSLGLKIHRHGFNSLVLRIRLGDEFGKQSFIRIVIRGK